MSAPAVSDDRERFRLLYNLGCAFAERRDIAELIPLVLEKCREVLDARGSSILLLDADTQELYFPYVAEQDSGAAARLSRLRVPVSEGVGGDVVRSGRGVRLDDAASDPRRFAGADSQTGVATGPLLAAPLTARGEVIGVIEAVRRTGDPPFGEADLSFLEALAAAVAVAIENAQLYGRLRASHEELRLELSVLRRDVARLDGFAEIIGTSAPMLDVFNLMQSAAASPITVLIEGETGTGKELVARGIHGASDRASGAFIAVNCAALPETLLESELFGHRRGAFTGAMQDRKGVFEAAGGGTIFLDEVGDMPASMQAKLLRVLQEGEVVPIGDTRPRKVDVRVISATNRHLEAEVERGTMRADLFYRLSSFPIRLPPLRERRGDVPLFVAQFLGHAAERHRKHVPGIDPAAIERLLDADWPGNVRQLQNEIERAVALARDGETLGMRHLSKRLQAVPAVEPSAPGAADATIGGSAPAPLRASPAPGPSGEGHRSAPPDDIDLRVARAAFEARHIAAVLQREAGNVSRAARALGLSRSMMQRKMKEYDLR